MIKVDFQGSTHEKLDLSSNETNGMYFNQYFLKDLTLDLYQCGYVARCLGVNLKE